MPSQLSLGPAPVSPAKLPDRIHGVFDRDQVHFGLACSSCAPATCQREPGWILVQYVELIHNMKLSQTPAVKSLDRGLDILEYVAGCSEPPSFSQLLADLGIPRSSLFHLLTNLLARNFLERDPGTERYRLGAEIIAIARKVRRPSLHDRLAPLLRALSLEVSETCGFYVQVGDAVEVIASAI